VDADFAPDVKARRNTSSLSRSSTLARLLSSQFGLKRAVRRALPNGMAEGWKRRAERWNRVAFQPPPMEAATRARLVAHFATRNDRLAALIGRDLSAWNRAEPNGRGAGADGGDD